MMNAETFGELVKALRLEHLVEPGKVMTQKMLAERAGIKYPTLVRIEAGNPTRLGPEVLTGLANALKLTAGEREQFFLASTLVEREQFVRQRNSAKPEEPEEILKRLMEELGGMWVPAFIHDEFADIVAANQMMLRLFRFPEELIAEQRGRIAGYNVMRIVFWPGYGFRGLVKDKWDETAIHNMHYFRASTLRHRTTDRFKKMYRVMMDWPQFQEYWYRASYATTDSHLDESLRYTYGHPIYGELDYSTAVSAVYTPFGSLRTLSYIPMGDDTHTAEVFRVIGEEVRAPQEQGGFGVDLEAQVRRFASWPG